MTKPSPIEALQRNVQLPALADDLRRLRAVSGVVSHGSAAGAAGAMHLSASSITRAVIDLEQALGIPLFDRGPRGMSATPAGRILGARLSRAWRELHDAAAEALHLCANSDAKAAGNSLRFAASVSGKGIRSLLTIAILGSEARAAARLSLTQPAVHAQLQEVERLAGTRLLHRSVRGTTLTEAGEVIVRGGKLAFAEIRMAAEELTAFTGAIRGRVTIGALPLSSAGMVPTVAADTALRYPDLQVTVVDGTYETMLRHLRNGDIDLIVGALDPDTDREDLVQEVLFRDTLCVVARSSHRAVVEARDMPVSLKSLCAFPWISPLPDTPSGTAFEQAFASESLGMPALCVQAHSPAIVKSLLIESDWLALLSRHQVSNEVRLGTLVLLPVPIKHHALVIGITTRSAGEPSPGARQVVQRLRQLAGLLLQDGPAEAR